jgi:hypothetical protein
MSGYRSCVLLPVAGFFCLAEKPALTVSSAFRRKRGLPRRRIDTAPFSAVRQPPATERRLLMTDRIFVFGSNLAGRHGKGAALCARQRHGAVYGQGTGLQGRSYAIPTKDERLNTLPLPLISRYVEQFKAFAAQNPAMTFEVTPIGCGLAGYAPAQIAPLFSNAPDNCILPDSFMGCL